MTKTITQINTATDTFAVFVSRFNEVANAFSTEAVTADGSANGSVTAGNTQHTGIFSGNNVAVSGALRGGNVQSATALTISSNVIITGNRLEFGNATINAIISQTGVIFSNTSVSYSYYLPTAAQKAANNFWLNANGDFGQIIDFNTGTQIVTTGTTAQLLDHWLKATYYGMEYTITIADNAANNRSITKAVTVHDEGNAYITEYATIDSNTSYGVLSANANTTAVRVYVTPISANTTIKVRKAPNYK